MQTLSLSTMKQIIVILIFLTCINAQSQIERDKALHFLGGNLYGLAGAGIAKQISDGNRYWTFVGAIGGATLIGLGKEAVDAGQRENGWDNDDLLATILGGMSVGFTVDIFTNKREQKRRADKLTTRKVDSFEVGLVLESSSQYDFPNKELPSLNSFSIPESVKTLE